jgi:hypothetical protein
MSNPWDERPWAETGNKSETEIFAAVGRASSHWELVEQAIAGLFTVVTVSRITPLQLQLFRRIHRSPARTTVSKWCVQL